MFLNMMQDWIGWLLMLFSFSIVLMWKSVRSDTKLVHAIWFCIVVHHVVAFLNAYVGTVIGAGQDAAKFHTTGVKLCNKTNVLLSVYSIFDFDLSDQHISNLFPFLDTTYQLTHQIGTLDTYSHSLGFLYSTLGASHFLVRSCRF